MATRRKKHAGGRPPKITMEVVERISERIGRGLTHEQACVLDGVRVEAWRRACERHPEFVAVLERESARFVDESTRVMCEPGYAEQRADWRGRAWILERRHRAQFGRQDITVHQEVHSNSFTLPKALLDELSEIPAEVHRNGQASNSRSE